MATSRKPKTIPEEDNDPIVRRAKWASLKAEFIDTCMSGQRVYWPALAKKYGFRVEYVRQKASRENWAGDVEKMTAEREEILERRLSERTRMALDQLEEDFATNEVAIRKRHATMARGLQAKAAEKLATLKLSDISVRDALWMLKLGVEEERFAMGFAQLFTGKLDDDNKSGYKPIAEQLGGHQRIQQIGALLMKAVKDGGLDSDLLEEAGLGPTDVEVKEAPRVDYLNPPKGSLPDPEAQRKGHQKYVKKLNRRRLLKPKSVIPQPGDIVPPDPAPLFKHKIIKAKENQNVRNPRTTKPTSE